MSRMALPKELFQEPTSNTKERNGMTGNQRNKVSRCENEFSCPIDRAMSDFDAQVLQLSRRWFRTQEFTYKP